MIAAMGSKSLNAIELTSSCDSWQMQHRLLDVGSQMEQVHDLRDACTSNVPSRASSA